LAGRELILRRPKSSNNRTVTARGKPGSEGEEPNTAFVILLSECGAALCFRLYLL